jgi:hypothetical protein
LWWVLFFLSVISYRYILSSMCFMMAFSLCNLIWIHLISECFWWHFHCAISFRYILASKCLWWSFFSAVSCRYIYVQSVLWKFPLCNLIWIYCSCSSWNLALHMYLQAFNLAILLFYPLRQWTLTIHSQVLLHLCVLLVGRKSRV